MSREEADMLEQQYPDWFRRHALDYMNDNSSRGLPTGGKLGLNDRGLRAYTEEGSAQAIQDPFAGMVSYSDQVERMAHKNVTANALIDLDRAVVEQGKSGLEPQMRQLVTPERYGQLKNSGEDMRFYTTSKGKDEATMNVFKDGEKQQYVSSNPLHIAAIENAHTTGLPSGARKGADFIRSALTSRNPAYLAKAGILDLPNYYVRTMAEGGARGILDLPKMTGTLLSAYDDVFRGLNPLRTAGGWVGGATAGGATAAATDENDPNRGIKVATAAALGSILGGRKAITNRIEGPQMQKFLEEGGGMAGNFGSYSPKDAAERVAELRQSHVLQVNGPDDMKRILAGLVKMRWVQAIGERVEAAPRVAASRMAESRGLDKVKGTIAGRDVTVDFDRGGRLIKFLNGFMPFLNAGFQGSATLNRMYRSNPGGTVASLGSLLIAPTMAAEAWNRSDPQREKDYENVPQSVKDQGVVVMLPTEAPVDKNGNRHPQYVHINLRELAPFAILAREGAQHLAGKGGRDWQELAGALATAQSPLQANNLSDLGSRFLGLPAAGTLVQLGANKDFFNDGPIVTQRADENASPLSKAVAPWLQRAMQAVNPNTDAEVRPSALDFIAKDAAGAYGNLALEGSRSLFGQAQDTTPQQQSVTGGLLSGYIGGSTGQRLAEARSDVLTPSARQSLRDAGITWRPSPVVGTIQKIPLRQEEQAKLQQLTNRYVDDAIQKAVRKTSFDRLPVAQKERYITHVVDGAHARAQGEVLRTIPPAQRSARRKSGSAKG
jgi:hypothetical protein